ncbi:hypothetical protein HDU85_005711 [Gaertneriomyces sp. JEL0708]|nr:hypothetical protein HDU85_005711 [Gaertneriomyces sp. JEL0708]
MPRNASASPVRYRWTTIDVVETPHNSPTEKAPTSKSPLSAEEEREADTGIDAPSQLSTGRTFLLLVTVLPEILIHHALKPLYPYMAKNFLPESENANIGYYAGLLASAYAFPTTFMDAVWGQLSDVRGWRVDCLIAGLTGYAFGTLFLGLSTSYTFVLLSLLLTGFFSSNSVIAKGMIGELAHDEQSRAWAYSTYGVVFSFAGICGTLAGGFLSDPQLFGGVEFLLSRPYFLVCMIGTGLAIAGVWIAMKTIRPTMKASAGYQMLDRHRSSDEDISSNSSYTTAAPTNNKPTRFHLSFITLLTPYLSLLTSRTLLPITLYLLYITFHTLLHTALPLYMRHLSLTSTQTSFAMSLMSMAKLAFKGLYYPIHNRLGTVTSYRLGCILVVPFTILIPFLGPTSPLFWAMTYLSTLVIGAGEGLCYLSTIMLLTQSVEGGGGDVKRYGLIHGLAGCVASLVKTVGPLVGGALWELGLARDMVSVVFWVVAGVAIGAVVLAGRVSSPSKEAGYREPQDEDVEMENVR